MKDERPWGEGLRLLYVEDEEITRQAVLTMLGRRFPELTLLWAGDGAGGLARFRDERPDLVVTDIKMPAMNGIEMARRILESDPKVPIVVTTAHSDLDYLIKSIEIGVSRYVLKPIESAKLFAAVEESLRLLSQQRERERAAREIEELNHRLAARARDLELANRDLEAFGHTISHDLRSPLTKISGYCQLIAEIYGPTLDEQCRRFIGIIEDETVEMGALIRTLLDFSRAGRHELARREADLSEMAQVISVELACRYAGRELSFAISPGLSASCDPDLVRVVLFNLLDNACKYTGGKDKGVIEFGLDVIGRERAYFVRDNGAGFDMALCGKLFHPFQRLHSDQEFSGTGIGLATVQRIVERHGGRVWAEGEPGLGAAFYFTLPA
ncbi:hypothetical protein GMSM_36470 [Geomonas sp. Red276]